MHGRLYKYFTDDHRRLGRLLDQALMPRGEIRRPPYDEFRQGLLRHIALEERILIPTVQRLQGGSPFVHAERLKLDHGAIAALLVPTPTPAILAALRGILRQHNRLEENPGGLYPVCEQLARAELDTIFAKIRAIGDVPLNPTADDPRILEATRRALRRAGYDLDDYSGLPKA